MASGRPRLAYSSILIGPVTLAKTLGLLNLVSLYLKQWECELSQVHVPSLAADGEKTLLVEAEKSAGLALWQSLAGPKFCSQPAAKEPGCLFPSPQGACPSSPFCPARPAWVIGPLGKGLCVFNNVMQGQNHTSKKWGRATLVMVMPLLLPPPRTPSLLFLLFWLNGKVLE